MTYSLQAECPPLREESDGSLRVGQSRVLLEIVIRAFEDGATPEAITQRYSTLSLPDVYAVIAYRLRHPEEVEAYLAGRERVAASVAGQFHQQRNDLGDIRARLLARRQARG